MKAVENRAYFLRSNLTGEEDTGCRFSFAYAKDALVFSFEVKDEDIVSPYREDNEDIWKADAVEVFISPDGDVTRYKELEVSPFGVRFYGDVKNEDGKTPVLEKIPPAFTARAECRRDGYAVTICLPLSALEGFDGRKMKFNAFRLDKKADGRQLLFALSPTFCDRFHRPAYFISAASDAEGTGE